ncbi:MAG: MFS transporter [Alphaproteobacteria bacterium]
MPPKQSSINRPLALSIVALGLITFAIGQTILFAVLGPIGRLIGLTEIQVGSITSASALTIALVSPFWGRRSTEWGRRRVIVIGLVAYGLTTAAFTWVAWIGMREVLGVAAVFYMLIAVRLVYALLSAGIQPAATAYIADMTSGRERAAGLALVGGALALGSVLGPAMTLLSVFGILVPLLAAAALALGGGLITLFLLPHGKRTSRIRQKPSLRFWDRHAFPFLALMFVMLVIGSSTQLTAAFYIQDLLGVSESYTTRLVGVAMAASAIAMIVAQGGIVQIFRPSSALLLRSGLALAAAGFGVLILAEIYLWLVVGYVIIGLGTGLLVPGILSAGSLSVDEDHQGDIAGLMGAAQASGFVVGPLIGTLLYEQFPLLVFYVNGGLALLLFAVVMMMRFPRAARGHA